MYLGYHDNPFHNGIFAKLTNPNERKFESIEWRKKSDRFYTIGGCRSRPLSRALILFNWAKMAKAIANITVHFIIKQSRNDGEDHEKKTFIFCLKLIDEKIILTLFIIPNSLSPFLVFVYLFRQTFTSIVDKRFFSQFDDKWQWKMIRRPTPQILFFRRSSTEEEKRLKLSINIASQRSR